MNDLQRVKLGFELRATEESWPPVNAEWLWFESERPFESARYRLVSVPWFVSGLALGDTIEAIVDEASRVERWSVAERSGSDLIWILKHELELWAEIDDLCDLGCLAENYQNFHFAVSVPASVETPRIDEILERIEIKQGQIAFPVWQRESVS